MIAKMALLLAAGRALRPATRLARTRLSALQAAMDQTVGSLQRRVAELGTHLIERQRVFDGPLRWAARLGRLA